MATTKTINVSKITHLIQRYSVFRGLTYLLYASVWMYYMHQLLSSNEAYCRDVQPTLRSVLLVLSWIKLVVTVVFVCFMLSNLLLVPTGEQFVFVLATLVIVGVFLYQIQFLNAVERSSAKAGECDDIESRKRRLVYVFTSIIFVLGVFLVLFGMTGGTFMERLVDSAWKGN
jgi:hypothetical protein